VIGREEGVVWEFFFEFSSKKMQAFMHFYWKITTCDQKLGPEGGQA